jgi:hypothetical protein
LHLIHSHNSRVQVMQRYSTHFPVHRYTRTRVLSLHLSYPDNGFITVSLSLRLTHEVFLAQSNYFLAISSQSPSIAISRTRSNSLPSRLLPSTPSYYYSKRPSSPFYNPSAWTPRKTRSSVVKEECLHLRYLAMDVLYCRVRVC